MSKKLRVALIFGGTSQEREISLASGRNVAAYLNPKKYDVIPVEISREGKWLVDSQTVKQIESESKTKQASSSKEIVAVGKNDKAGVDVAFLALHGPGGEDGTIQGILQSLGVKYTGSGVLASALAMDKAKTKRMVASEGINVAPHIIVDGSMNEKKYLQIFKNIGIDCVVKPNRIGSSLGVSIVRSKKELEKALENALAHDTEVMIEPHLKGREFTIPVLGNKKLQVLPVIEIIPKTSEFFDFESKYDPKATDEIVPAQISKSLEKNLQDIAAEVHRLLGCRGVSRSDFIVTKDGKIYFLEINTIPGMTANSLVPKSSKVAGISYSQLLDKLIKLALDKE